MKSFKVALAAAAAVISLVSLSGCTTASDNSNSVPVPKTARYSTGLSVSKPVTAITTERNTVVAAITKAVGTSATTAGKNALVYNNLTVAGYDLGANSPYFVNKTRTTTKCSPGKSQGPDIGQGYYVVGDSFINPAAGKTLPASTVNAKLAAVVKTLIRDKTITTAYATASKGDGKYEFKTKAGNTIRIKSTVASDNVAVIRVSDVLTTDTCYNLNALPYTTAAAVTAWQRADKAAGVF